MFRNNYKIADHIICIDSIYDEVQQLCKDYLSDAQAEINVKVTQADIDFEREKSAREDVYEGIPVRNYPDSYLETLAVYRKICSILINDDIILFHGSVISVDGEAYLFTAKSGTGKSTHTRLWREYFGERAVMVNDDKPLIHIDGDSAVVYGTPWDGKHHLSTNTAVKLKAVCILERSKENHIEQITPKAAYPMLMQQVYRPNDPAILMKTFDMIDKFTSAVRLYRLGCNISMEAVEVAYNAMKG